METIIEIKIKVKMNSKIKIKMVMYKPIELKEVETVCPHSFKGSINRSCRHFQRDRPRLGYPLSIKLLIVCKLKLIHE